MAEVTAKSQLTVRWIVLVLACVMMIGNYYCYDNPSALQSQMKSLMGSKSGGVLFGTYFNLLYTVYSIPNMVLPFFGGFFVDKLGCSVCLVVFSAFILAGQIVFAFGSSIKSWPVMLLGRVIFGFGGESITVAQSALLADWFAGGELAFAFGINLSISRLGSVINDVISPALANNQGVSFALFFGVLVCGMSLFTAVLLAPINSSAEKSIKYGDINDDIEDANQLTKKLINNTDGNGKAIRSSFGERAVSSERLSSLNLSIVGQSEQIDLRDVFKFGKMFWTLALSCLVVYGCVLPFNNVASGILLERNYFKEPSSSCQLTYPTMCTDGPLAPINGNPDSCGDVSNTAPVLPTTINAKCPYGVDCNDKYYNLTNIKEDDVDCSDPFWGDDKDKTGNLVSTGCVSSFCNEKDDATEKSGKVMSIPYLLSACLSPVLGFAVDKIGMRAVIASIAPLVLIAVHLTLGLSDGSPYLPLIGQGISYSCFAAVLWPSVPYSVPEKSIGTAYGLITAIQNSGLALFPIIISVIYNSDDSHYIPNVEYFFVACACCGVVVGIFLNIIDANTGSKLNSKSSVVDGDEIDSEDEDLIKMDNDNDTDSSVDDSHILSPPTPTLTI